MTEDNLRVGGHFRMQLVYRILSEDLIETLGRLPEDHASGNGSVGTLCDRIGEVTGFDPGLIRKTMEDFVGAGYIKTATRRKHPCVALDAQQPDRRIRLLSTGYPAVTHPL